MGVGVGGVGVGVQSTVLSRRFLALNLGSPLLSQSQPSEQLLVLLFHIPLGGAAPSQVITH